MKTSKYIEMIKQRLQTPKNRYIKGKIILKKLNLSLNSISKVNK